MINLIFALVKVAFAGLAPITIMVSGLYGVDANGQPNSAACVQAVYTECSVALRGKNKGEENWPASQDGWLEILPSNDRVLFYPNNSISAAGLMCVQETIESCDD